MSGSPEKRQPDTRGFLDVEGGKRVFWERFGRGDRDAVCLLNGLAMHTKAWYSFLDELHPEWDVVLYDYLGQGESTSDDEPVTIPQLAGHLAGVLDQLSIPRIHLMGVSYGGFVALDFARLFQQRLMTLGLSGILLSHERLFQMYQDLSLRFYAGGPEAFELYTHYLYEKIFGEAFVHAVAPTQLETIRSRFHERYRDRVHSLVRLTEAQIPFFAELDKHMEGYRAVRTPTLILAGEQDRAIPVWMQRPIADIIPHTVFESVPDCGHVVYLEQRRPFFDRWREFMRPAPR